MVMSFEEFCKRYLECVGKMVEFVYPTFRVRCKIKSAEDALDEIESKSGCSEVYVYTT